MYSKYKKPRKKYKNLIIIIILFLLVVPIIFGYTTPPPDDTSFESPLSSVSDLKFIYDLSYIHNNHIVREQNILNEQIKLIQSSEQFIVADIFLYNEYYNAKESEFPASTLQLTNALIEQKRKNPQLSIYLITDEINNSYGNHLSKQFIELKKNGIEVIITDLNKIRDSNPLYAGYWRTYIKPFGVEGKGWVDNPFGTNGPKVNIRNILKLLNFKANHRKTLITDKGAIISSSNPHDASSFHSNVAFYFNGEAVKYLLEAEKAVARFSGHEIKGTEYISDTPNIRMDTEVKILTENKIKEQIISHMRKTESGDIIRMGMFYLSHREIIKELLEASLRGVKIHIVLDPNKDAFGFEKNGIPNRQVASELIEKSNKKIEIRWYDTHGEQYHSKIIGIERGDELTLIAGSANYTRRNLNNYNLEANIMVTIKKSDAIANDFNNYFNRIWNNHNGTFTSDYSAYEDNSQWKVFVYRFQESTGLCTF